LYHANLENAGLIFDKGDYLSKLCKRLFSCNLYNMRFAALLLGIVIYAIAGTPTPDAPGIIEICVAFLLIFAMGVDGLRYAISPLNFKTDEMWVSGARILLYYGITVSLLAAVLNGHNLSAILRDLTAFMFLLLPIFIRPLLQNLHPDKFRFIIAACIFSGCLFAIRDWAGLASISIPGIVAGERLSYLSNSPLTLMAAISLAGIGICLYYRGEFVRGWLLGSILLGIAVFPLATMAMGLQRASIGCFLLAVSVFLGIAMWSRPKRFTIPVLLLGIGTVCIFPMVENIGASLFMKSDQVGFNMRPEEIKAVWNGVFVYDGTGSINNISFLTGLGWGGSFRSPAVGMMEVYFTHGLMGSALLKTGLIGFFLHAFYLAAIASCFLRVRKLRQFNMHDYNLAAYVILLSLLCPFLIDIFLYAAFKSLDFGLILVLMSIFTFSSYKDKRLSLVKCEKLP